MSGKLLFGEKLGHGTYGEVFEASREGSDHPLAIKRNYTDKTLTGLGSLRELDFLIELRNHPCIIEITEVTESKPFRDHKVKDSSFHKDMKEDKIHFIMDMIPKDGFSYTISEYPSSDKMLYHMTWKKIKDIQKFDDPRVTAVREKMLALFQEPSGYEPTIIPPSILELDRIIPQINLDIARIVRERKELAVKRKEYYHRLKIIFCQILLGIEYCHGRGIIHRDIKPCNILIKPGDIPEVKICDFGLSRRVCRSNPSSPRAMTTWYRAPEVCCGDPEYSEAVDIWSIGATFFEMVSNRALFQESTDDDAKIFNNIIGRMETIDPIQIQKVREKGTHKISITTVATPPTRKTLKTRLGLSEENEEYFTSESGSYDQFIDLLQKMLQIDPDRRITATQAIDHPFFSFFTPYINGMREQFPPVPEELPIIKIISRVERDRAVRIIFQLYNEELEYQKSSKSDRRHWYKHAIMFHALRLFDQYLVWLAESKPDFFHPENESNFIFYTCIYIMHKFYSTLELPNLWIYVFPRSMTRGKTEQDYEDCEYFLVCKIFKFRIFSPSLIEMMDRNGHSSSEDRIRNLLLKYGEKFNYEGTMADLYRVLI